MAGHPFTGKRSTLSQHSTVGRYRCPECNGKGFADNGRVRVAHRQDCAIFLRMVLRHPRFFAVLDEYRKQTA